MRQLGPIAALSLIAVALFPTSVEAETDALAVLRGATVGVGRPIIDGTKLVFAPIGSAVLVKASAKRLCIVTAKHVFFNPSQGYAPDKLLIRLPKDAISEDEDDGVEIELITNNKNNWKSLDDGSDLAIIDAPNLSKYFRRYAISVNQFGNEADIFQGATVVIIGYPGLLSTYYAKTPILRGGLIAWVDPDGQYTKPFLVDANLFPGNSGGPVFRSKNGMEADGSIGLGGGYSLIGIVSQGPRQFAPVRTGESPVVRQNPEGGPPVPALAEVLAVGGIGAIEPISKIKNLVELYCSS